jgi:type II secretory pathway pseudopilin PulG
MVPRSWSEWLGLLILLGVVAICAFFAGVASRTYVINDTRQQINALQKDNRVLREAIQHEKDAEKALADKLAASDNQLKDAFNAYRTIVLNGNDTTSVSTGHFTVGLMGPPTNEKVSVNVNGSPHTVAAGDSIDIGSSTCRVEVKSFDMFKVTLLTSCTPTKP